MGSRSVRRWWHAPGRETERVGAHEATTVEGWRALEAQAGAELAASRTTRERRRLTDRVSQLREHRERAERSERWL